MPLSENEQRLLEQMEQALYAEDPKFASALRGVDLRAHHRRRVIKASVGFVVGIALLIAGIKINWGVSILGFVLMLASAFFAVSSLRHMPSASDVAAGRGALRGRVRGARGRQSKTGFMARMENRWNRRREQGGR